jgi:opacity protein-like surface antigen
LDVGVTIMNNVWISLGYNFVGFRDEDFSASRYTDRGPFLRVRVKADQDTFRNLRLDSLRPSR